MRQSERLAEEISRLIKQNKWDELQVCLDNTNLLELTQSFSRLDMDTQVILLNRLPVEKSARLLKLALRFDQSLTPLLEHLKEEDLSKILAKSDPDDAKDIIQRLPRKEEKDILQRLETSKADQVRHLETYQKDTAGSLMNPQVISLREDLTIEESLRLIRKHVEAEMVFYLYVVDMEDKLKGVVSLRRLVTSPSHQPIREILIPAPVSIKVSQPVADISEVFERTGFLALPVVDEKERLLGIISRDDVMSRMQDQTESTLFKLGGVSSKEFYGAPVYKIVPYRLPWLGASMLGGLLNALILHHYTQMLSLVVTLTLFIPVLLGLSETVATQTATLIIRGLALGEMENRRLHLLILREIVTGFILGFLSGLILGLITSVWMGTNIVVVILLISITVSIALASLLGTVIPLLFRFLKIDPALASSAFVLTLTDLCAMCVYLFTAVHMLPYPPH